MISEESLSWYDEGYRDGYAAGWSDSQYALTQRRAPLDSVRDRRARLSARTDAPTGDQLRAHARSSWGLPPG